MKIENKKLKRKIYRQSSTIKKLQEKIKHLYRKINFDRQQRNEFFNNGG